MTLEQDIKIFRRLNPNMSISDEDLKVQLTTFRRFSPHANLEKILLGQNEVWNDFLNHYPQADTNHFERINIDGKKFEVDFVGEDGYRKEVWRDYVSDPKTWSQSLKKALGPKTGFPDSLLTTNEVYPIPGIPFVDTRERSAFSTDIQIHVSPSESFIAKFRNIFKNTLITHTSLKEANRWLSEPQYRNIVIGHSS